MSSPVDEPPVALVVVELPVEPPDEPPVEPTDEAPVEPPDESLEPVVGPELTGSVSSEGPDVPSVASKLQPARRVSETRWRRIKG